MTRQHSQHTQRGYHRSVALGAVVLMFMSWSVLSAAEPAQRPNVVIVITDSMTGKTMEPESGCITPNLDTLAAEGVRLHRYYTTQPACCAARASIMTGTYPSTHGIWDFVHGPMGKRVKLNEDLTFWSQSLTEAGYATGYIGKWHVEQGGNPTSYGFQERWPARISRGKIIPGTEVTYSRPGYGKPLLAAVEQARSEPPTIAAFDKTIEYIRRQEQQDAPFCCVCSFYHPHLPARPPKRFYDMYDVDKIPLSPSLRDNLEGKSDFTKRLHSVLEDLSDDDWRQIITCYNATVTFIDSEIGRLVNAMKDAGVYENTILIVTTDHGSMYAGHGLLSHNGGTPYEEVYNIPFVIRGPGVKARGEDRTSVASLVDLGPTLVDLCGAEDLQDAQGRSMRPILEGRAKAEDWQDAYAEHDSTVWMYTQRIVWHGPWKYIYAPGGVDELYNLDKDPHEEHNLASDPQYRSTLEDMVKRMWRKIYDIGDKVMTLHGNEVLDIAPVGPLSHHDAAHVKRAVVSPMPAK